MKKIFLPVAVLIAAALSFSVRAGDAPLNMTFLSEYVQTLYDEDSVIPIGQAKAALQTSDGYMWFAGYQGLMRYDGLDTRVFSADDGFPSYSVNVLFEDSARRLWVGTNDKGLALYEAKGFLSYSIADGLPSASVRGIAEDETGNIYVSTTNGIAAISPDGTLAPHPELNNVFSTVLRYLGGGRFICLLNDGTLVLFDESRIVQAFESGHFGGGQPISLCIAASGEIYIGTNENSIHIAAPDLSGYRTIAVPSRNTINGFFEDENGRIFVCADNGLGYLTGNGFVPVDGLAMSNSIEHIYKDYEGNFWICSSRQGLLQLTRGKFTNISFLAGLPDYTVNTTAVWQGDLYIGADEGLVILRDNAPLQNELTEMLDGIRIRSLLADSAGRLWICTYESFGVITLWPDGSMTSVNADDGLASNKVRCIFEAKNGDMLVGMSGGVSVIRDGRVAQNYTSGHGLINDVILSVCEGANGVVYAGSDGGGIYAIDGDTVTNYSEKDGLEAGIILRMTPVGDMLWISTGNSICVMDGSGIRMVEKLAAFDDNVFDILPVGDDIWFLHSKGVNICSAQSLLSDGELQMTQMLARDGLSSPVTANSWNGLSPDGVLYISTGKGVLSVDTARTHKSGAAPLAAISDLLADGRPVEPGESLSSNVQRVDIHISLNSFSSKEGTVSYMLEGFDAEPVTVPRTELSWISYTNLPGGKYTFRLYGTNAAGVRSETVEMVIRKDFALPEMPFVRLLIVFTAIGALVLCVRVLISLRTRAAIAQKQEYKEITGQIMALAAAMVDSRNEYTAGHSRRVAEYSKLVGRRMGMTESELEALHSAAILHDVGKISVPDRILDKKGSLNGPEREEMKRHAAVGAALLSEVTVIDGVELGAKYHHERVDGAGYPDGLYGDDIPLTAKIISVCNALDSMLSDRPYRKALSLESAQSELIHNAGTQFDERVTAILISLIHEGSVPLR